MTTQGRDSAQTRTYRFQNPRQNQRGERSCHQHLPPVLPRESIKQERKHEVRVRSAKSFAAGYRYFGRWRNVSTIRHSTHLRSLSALRVELGGGAVVGIMRSFLRRLHHCCTSLLSTVLLSLQGRWKKCDTADSNLRQRRQAPIDSTRFDFQTRLPAISRAEWRQHHGGRLIMKPWYHSLNNNNKQMLMLMMLPCDCQDAHS